MSIPSGNIKKIHLLYLLFFLLIVYLVMNTGIFSDDYEAMVRAKSEDFRNILIPSGNFYYADTPVLNYTHYLWYRFISIDNQTIINVLKISYILLAFCLSAQFFKIFVKEPLALLISFIFIFFPSHDSTVYMFMNQYLTLSFAFYLYAYYLAHRGKLLFAFLSGMIASFMSYGSTPIALSLCLLFVLSKKYKQAAIIVVPNIIYSSFFIIITTIAKIGHPRVLETLNASTLVKQFVLQVATFLDATCGPSMWLKIFYSFSQLSLLSFIIGIFVVIGCYGIIRRYSARYDPRLVISLAVLLITSLFMFAVTGRYPQLCFGLGNRVSIYGALLFAYLIVLMPGPKKNRAVLLSLLLFTIVGGSDHWKSWSCHQQAVISNIRENKGLRNYKYTAGNNDIRVIFVSGNQFSKYGPISNIEFFSENWVPTHICRLLFGRLLPTGTINKRFKYEDGYLIDPKYNNRIKVDGYINVYDSEKNELLRVDAGSIKSYIESLPSDKRHWVQFLDLKRMNQIILKLMPRLDYAI